MHACMEGIISHQITTFLGLMHNRSNILWNCPFRGFSCCFWFFFDKNPTFLRGYPYRFRSFRRISTFLDLQSEIGDLLLDFLKATLTWSFINLIFTLRESQNRKNSERKASNAHLNGHCTHWELRSALLLCKKKKRKPKLCALIL